MIVPKQNKLAIQTLWANYENYLMPIFEALTDKYQNELKPASTEFDAAKQQIELVTKKQTIIDIKKILSGTYEKN